MEKKEIRCIRVFADQAQILNCKEQIKVAENSFANLAQVLSLAGNEVRLKILFLLNQETELCPCDISDILEMTVPAVSQHLRKLKDANLIQFRKVGQTVFYSLKTNHLKVIEPLFEHIQQAKLAL
ncbi:ArsR family transcriptional regulator [Lacihabitans sp. CCS-44]|uniref:ArsR/SmtB family transcription factor n=1 Tax=Lacihabitans sp. CCS-44 TaxID=2487331 RepID=UPI0020CD11C1|nr:metalloregulator ArsR/SmtB family transcription factor [Lacihabitans sp. CCS-44]MCP9755961.1 ArsR family transcriptional regulator [Lacihabitans sp. CCS-44]